MDASQQAQIEKLYFDMFKKLKAYARSSLKSESLAEEAAQETFSIACQHPEKLLTSDNPRGWLVITLKNTIRNMKRNRIATQQILSVYLKTINRELPNPENVADLKLLYGDAADTEEFRLLVELAIEGRSHEEMARARGITISACKKRVERAKKILQKNI